MILGLCDRFHKLPSEVLAEDAELMQMIEIARLGRPDPPPEPEPSGEMEGEDW